MKIKILLISLLFLVFLSSCEQEKQENKIIKISNSITTNTDRDFELKELFR
jgi:ABC-type uncharacterized transport system auxiliary subunit